MGNTIEACLSSTSRFAGQSSVGKRKSSSSSDGASLPLDAPPTPPDAEERDAVADAAAASADDAARGAGSRGAALEADGAAPIDEVGVVDIDAGLSALADEMEHPVAVAPAAAAAAAAAAAVGDDEAAAPESVDASATVAPATALAREESALAEKALGAARQSAMHEACREGRVAEMELYRSDAARWGRDAEGNTPLHLSLLGDLSRGEGFAATRLLAELPLAQLTSDDELVLHVANSRGETPLLLLCRARDAAAEQLIGRFLGFGGAAQQLMARGSDAERTPLHEACIGPASAAKHAAVVAMLSAAELDGSELLDGWIDARDAQSKSAVDLALDGGDDALVLLLRDFAERADEY
jgi:hypothetical protein